MGMDQKTAGTRDWFVDFQYQPSSKLTVRPWQIVYDRAWKVSFLYKIW